MKLTIFGATGGTGRLLVDQALAAGHQVTAVVRDERRLGGPRHPQLLIEVADVMRPNTIVGALTGREAAISALGPRPKDKTPVCAHGAASIITAMRDAGVRRLVVVTASGHVIDDGDGPGLRVLKPLLGRTFLASAFSDFRQTEQLVRSSGLNWTIMRPPRLTDGKQRPFRTAVDRNVRGGATIARADLAAATLTAVADPSTVGHTIGLGY